MILMKEIFSFFFLNLKRKYKYSKDILIFLKRSEKICSPIYYFILAIGHLGLWHKKKGRKEEKKTNDGTYLCFPLGKLWK